MHSLEFQMKAPHPYSKVAWLNEALPKAFKLLGAQDFDSAWRLAERELARARRCTCCVSLLAHVYDRIGSDLFLDDDPEQLVLAFNESERDQFSVFVIAACVVVSGRIRVHASLQDE